MTAKTCARFLSLCSGLLVVLPHLCIGQVIDPATAAQEPVPGAGHHYIGVGSETVNPADGSVTFDLPIQTPAGRQLSFPFSIRFNSSEPLYLTNNQESLQFWWQTPTNYENAPPFSLNGWSYSLPSYTAEAFVANSYPSSSSTPDDIVFNVCWGSQNYRFNGFDHSYALSAAYGWPQPNNPQTMSSNTYICNYSNVPNDPTGPAPYTRGGDDGVAESFGTVPSNPDLDSSTQPPLIVTDKSGTEYVFPYGPSVGNSTSPSVPFGALAQSIVDRDGNKIQLSASQGIAVTGGSTTLPSGSYTDTLGRTVLSWSGLNGQNYSSTTCAGAAPGVDSIMISGLGCIYVKWTTTTITFPSYSYKAWAVSAGAQLSNCALKQVAGISMQVVQEIDLPNGQNYYFTWGDPTGRLSKIRFPDGGYVRYAWGINPTSTSTLVAENTNISNPNAHGNFYCWATADTAAVTDRWVSYDGKTDALHQQFLNYSTAWVEENNIYSSLVWTSKTATIETEDPISGTTFTNYTYGPSPIVGDPNDYTWQSPDPAVPVENTVTYQDGGHNTFKTVNKTWVDAYSMVGEQTILNGDNSHGITTIRCIDNLDRVLADYDYDFPSSGGTASFPADKNKNCLAPPNQSGQGVVEGGLTSAAIGQLLRQTITQYHTFPGTNILDRPDSVATEDGSGNMLAQVAYQYDHYGSSGKPTGSGVSSSLLASAPGGNARGNATSVSRWLNTTNSYLTTAYSYYDTGQVYQKTDPCTQAGGVCPDVTSAAGQITTYSYADNFAANTGSYSSQTNGYLTSVTYPNTGIAHIESYTWGYIDGLLRTHADQNHLTTTFCYTTGGCGGTANDKLLRLTGVQGPPDPNNSNYNSNTTYQYTDWTSYSSTNAAQSSITRVALENTAGAQITSTSVLDGLGHEVETELSDPAGTVYTATQYDGLGRKYEVWNPTRCPPSQTGCSESTWGFSTYAYDSLGRLATQTNADGSTQQWSYNSNVVTSQDEDKNEWSRTSDALGRLVKVLEPSGAAQNGTVQTPTLETDYSYDILGNLTAVNQCGGTCPSSKAVGRSFTYDSLSRLIQAFNPEAGWTCYGTTGGSSPNGSNCTGGYDADGNLAYKTDARAILTTYSFDALNRPLSKGYSNDPGSSPWSCFQYDSSSTTYSVGRLTSEWTVSPSVGSCSGSKFGTKRSILAYDVMGRILQERQYTPATQSAGTPYSPQYSYDLAGNLITSTDGTTPVPNIQGATLTFTTCWDQAGRLSSVVSNWVDTTHPQSLLSAQKSAPTGCPTTSSVTVSSPYAPFGGLQNGIYGNSGVTLNRLFDNRLRVIGETDTGDSGSAATKSSATVTVTGMEQIQ